ncbi:MAG: DNA-binding response regulator, partial [Actinobacteria bacterium]|nr:DNA-binding response regulator [Actinomycetota bacterium]
LSVHTVRGYVKEVLRKLGAHSQLEAVAIARRAGLLPDAS